MTKPKCFEDIEKEIDEKFWRAGSDDLAIEIKRFLRTAIRQAFEETRVEDKEANLNLDENEYAGWSDCERAVKSAQDKFMEEKQ